MIGIIGNIAWLAQKRKPGECKSEKKAKDILQKSIAGQFGDKYAPEDAKCTTKPPNNALGGSPKRVEITKDLFLAHPRPLILQ